MELARVVRVLAATNRDLREARRNGSFREDLYDRLKVISITLPPLRDRPGDLPALIDYFVERLCREVERPRMGIAREAMTLLRSHSWPGNVRELKNVIERAVVLSSGPDITAADLPAEVRRGRPG